MRRDDTVSSAYAICKSSSNECGLHDTLPSNNTTSPRSRGRESLVSSFINIPDTDESLWSSLSSSAESVLEGLKNSNESARISALKAQGCTHLLLKPRFSESFCGEIVHEVERTRMTSRFTGSFHGCAICGFLCELLASASPNCM